MTSQEVGLGGSTSCSLLLPRCSPGKKLVLVEQQAISSTSFQFRSSSQGVLS